MISLDVFSLIRTVLACMLQKAPLILGSILSWQFGAILPRRITAPVDDSAVVEFIPRSYEEDPGPPQKGSIRFIRRFSCYKWLVKVTFEGTLQAPASKPAQRRKNLEELCRRIDFTAVQLLDSTVTELILSLQHDVSNTQELPIRAVLTKTMHTPPVLIVFGTLGNHAQKYVHACTNALSVEYIRHAAVAVGHCNSSWSSQTQ
jgi:hypothetical protein